MSSLSLLSKMDIQASKVSHHLTKNMQMINYTQLPVQVETSDFVTSGAYKLQIHNDATVWYIDETHIYFFIYNGIRYPLISVTTFIDCFSKQFDVERMSLACARKAEYTCECLNTDNWDLLGELERASRIKIAWEENKNKAAFYGSTIHSSMEHWLKNRHLTTGEVQQYIYNRFAVNHSEIGLLVDDFRTRYIPILASYELHSEPLLFDLQISLSGQSDLVIVDPVNKTISIADFKTNKVKPGSREDKAYGNMEGVLKAYPDNSMSHYALQTCLYQQMYLHKMQRIDPEYRKGTNYILWANRETGQWENVPVDPMQHEQVIWQLYNFMYNLLHHE